MTRTDMIEYEKIERYYNVIISPQCTDICDYLSGNNGCTAKQIVEDLPLSKRRIYEYLSRLLDLKIIYTQKLDKRQNLYFIDIDDWTAGKAEAERIKMNESK